MNPEIRSLNWEPDLGGVDKVFDFIYFMASVILLMLLSVGMEKAAQAGW